MRTHIRKAIGGFVCGAGIGGMICGWFLHGPATYSASGPDAARGLIYACALKPAPWYFSATDIVASWDVVAFAIIAFLGVVIIWEESEPGNRRKVPNFKFRPGIHLPILLGVAIAIPLVLNFEPNFINWIIGQGLDLSSTPCFALSPRL